MAEWQTEHLELLDRRDIVLFVALAKNAISIEIHNALTRNSTTNNVNGNNNSNSNDVLLLANIKDSVIPIHIYLDYYYYY